MQRKMKLEIWNKCSGGAGNKIEVEIVFTGRCRTDLLKKIQAAEDEILYFMSTGDMKKEPCFIFGDFIIRKAGIQAIRLTEADF